VKSIEDIVAGHRVVICAGSGGVGKTTTAAALALHGAQSGRRTIVLTIDPAKRLADALGVKNIGNQECEVKIGKRGSLAAMMLDQKGAWDRLVERYAPSADARARILNNRFYQHLSQSFAGSQEYMAVQQLAELHGGGRYDLIVVDTPPTRHALDFLEAPQRLSDFLSRDVIRWFLKPYFSAGWSTLRLVNRTVGVLFRKLEEATGVSALVEVSDFFNSMSTLFDGFEERVKRVYQLLRSSETAFLIVASPDEQVLTEAEYFCRQVKDLGVKLRGVVFNRVQSESEIEGEPFDEGWLAGVVGKAIDSPERRTALVQNFLRYETQARGDDVRIEAFRQQLPRGTAIAVVPNFEEDLHDLEGLRRMLPHLLAA